MQRGPRLTVGLAALIGEGFESRVNPEWAYFGSGFFSSGLVPGLGGAFGPGLGVVVVAGFGATGFSVVDTGFGGAVISVFGAEVVFAGAGVTGFAEVVMGFEGVTEAGLVGAGGIGLGAEATGLATAAVFVVAVLAAATVDGGASCLASSVTGLGGGGLKPAGGGCDSAASGLAATRVCGCPPFAEARLPLFCDAWVRF